MEENKVVTVKSQQSTNIRKPWTMTAPNGRKETNDIFNLLNLYVKYNCLNITVINNKVTNKIITHTWNLYPFFFGKPTEEQSKQLHLLVHQR